MKEEIVINDLPSVGLADNGGNWSDRNEEPMQFDSKKAFDRLSKRMEEEGLNQPQIQVANKQNFSLTNSNSTMVKALRAFAVFIGIAIVAYVLWG